MARFGDSKKAGNAEARCLGGRSGYLGWELGLTAGGCGNGLMTSGVVALARAVCRLSGTYAIAKGTYCLAAKAGVLAAGGLRHLFILVAGFW